MADLNQSLDIASKLLTVLVTTIALLIGLLGWIRGWWKGFKKWNMIANKANLFIDVLFPKILGHLCSTERFPKDILQEWTTLLSVNNFGRTSPITITDQGYKTIRESGMDKIFEANKEAWVQKVKFDLGVDYTRLDVERRSIGLIARLYTEDDKVFNPIKEYLYEHPGSIPTADIYGLLGILLRDYILDKKS